MKVRDPVLRSALASEYVLGTLQGGARRRFERLLERDPALRGEVEGWEASLDRLLDDLPAREPPVRAWAAISRRVALPTRETKRNGLWLSFPFWRGLSAAASTLALVLALYIGFVPSQAPATFVVVITDDAHSQASWMLSGKADSRKIAVRTLVPRALPPGRAFQLWVLPAGEKRVRSVGLIPTSGRVTLSVNEPLAALLVDAKKFGVSIESPNGSPTGQPTTTPLYHGKPISL